MRAVCVEGRAARQGIFFEKGFSYEKKLITLILGIVCAAVLFIVDIPGLSPEGRRCMGMSLLAVFWWTGGGHASGLYITSFASWVYCF